MSVAKVSIEISSEGKTMSTRRATERNEWLERKQQAERWRLDNRCQQWNATCPKGTKVRYFSIACEDLKFVETTTRSEAWIIGGDSLVVMLDGVSGCVACDHIQLVTKETP